MFYLGIDIAKTNHVASLIDSDGNILVKHFKFTNSTEGYHKLLDSIKDFSSDKSNILIAMEATGHYWLSLFTHLSDDNFDVSIFNPFQLKDFRPSVTLRKKKNDNVDSVIIANYLRFVGTNYSNLPSEDILTLKQFTRFRANLVSSVASLKTKVIGILDKVFPEYSSAFSDTFGSTSKQVLLKCSTPNEILKFDTRTLINLLSKYSKGRLGKSTSDKLKSIAKSSFGIKISADACSFEIKQLINQIIFIEDQIKGLDDEITSLYSKLDSHLLSVPGIGKALAPVILAEIGDIHRFDHPRKLVAFAGQDPSENQSGNSRSSNEETSKRGSSYLRHAIHTASFVASNNDPVLKAYYNKKISEGKHHYVALANISRKLLTIIWHLLREDRDYIPFNDISSSQ